MRLQQNNQKVDLILEVSKTTIIPSYITTVFILHRYNLRGQSKSQFKTIRGT